MRAGIAETESASLEGTCGHRPNFRLDWYEGRREAAKTGLRAVAPWWAADAQKPDVLLGLWELRDFAGKSGGGCKELRFAYI